MYCQFVSRDLKSNTEHVKASVLMQGNTCGLTSVLLLLWTLKGMRFLLTGVIIQIC
jgi:hypothetical protein